MHDGKFTTIEEVIDLYSTGIQPHPQIDSRMACVNDGGMNFTATEKEAVLAFLLTLTDSAFTEDPKFSNPFK